MLEDNFKNFNLSYKVLAGILLAIVGFFGVNLYYSLTQIQKELYTIKMSLLEVQMKMLTTDRIREIAHDEIIKYHRYNINKNDKN